MTIYSAGNAGSQKTCMPISVLQLRLAEYYVCRWCLSALIAACCVSVCLSLFWSLQGSTESWWECWQTQAIPTKHNSSSSSNSSSILYHHSSCDPLICQWFPLYILLLVCMLTCICCWHNMRIEKQFWVLHFVWLIMALRVAFFTVRLEQSNRFFVIHISCLYAPSIKLLGIVWSDTAWTQANLAFLKMGAWRFLETLMPDAPTASFIQMNVFVEGFSLCLGRTSCTPMKDKQRDICNLLACDTWQC